MLLRSSVDVDLDISLIVSSLAPSILIIVTYYFTKKKNDIRHENNTTSLDTIKSAVNGQLAAANKKIEELEEDLRRSRKGK